MWVWSANLFILDHSNLSRLPTLPSCHLCISDQMNDLWSEMPFIGGGLWTQLLVWTNHQVQLILPIRASVRMVDWRDCVVSHIYAHPGSTHWNVTRDTAPRSMFGFVGISLVGNIQIKLSRSICWWALDSFEPLTFMALSALAKHYH